MPDTPVRGPIEAPLLDGESSRAARWGSDVCVELLRRLGIEYVAVMPGSTTRGLHDSVVNYAGNTRPELILCNHEMVTVALARGYARVTGRPMAALIHNVVGLLNTAMTIYDAWVDRVPVLVLGGTGPTDAARRRPGIDWRHTANLQGNAVRDYTKWDDQPVSVEAMVESVLRAHRIATTAPHGPVYVCLDVDLQEQPATEALPDVARYAPARPIAPEQGAVEELAGWLVDAELPFVVADKVGRDAGAVATLRELAELLAIPVLDQGERMNFPTPHPLNVTGMTREIVADADVVVGLDAPNLAGALRGPVDYTTRASDAIVNAGRRVGTVSLDELSMRAWATDYQMLPPVDLPVLADTAVALPLLLEECRRRLTPGARSRVEARRDRLDAAHRRLREKQRGYVEEQWDHPQITEARLLVELWEVVRQEDFVFTVARPTVMAPGVLHLDRPDQFVCSGSGGGAVGSAPGVALGAALALRDTGRLPVAVMGDGTFFGSIQALWTAARYRVPALWVINNNRSYYNDEDHQERIARYRDRPEANKWIAQRMERPEVDFAAITRTFDLHGEGPVTEAKDLAGAFRRAIDAVRKGRLAVVDVWTENRVRG